MASEYVLISKHKYEQLEKDANSTDRQISSMDGVGMGQNSDKSSTYDNYDDDGDDDDKTIQPPPSSTTADSKTVDLHTYNDNISSDQHSRNNDYYISDLLESFNPSELKYVHPIINDMEKHRDILTWDKKTGEILFQHKNVSDSNIIELLKDTLTASLHSTGKMEFYRSMSMLNIKPKYLKHFKNKSLLAIIKGKKKIKQNESSTKSKKVVKKKIKQNKIDPKSKKVNPIKSSDNKSSWISWV